jgi:TRAP-type C4-dicarboxylate transport system permease small subunit
MTDTRASNPLSVPATNRATTPPRPGAFRAFLWAATHFEEVVTAILLAAMLGSVGISVFCRFILRQPLSWTEEVVLMCMVWTCFLGASVVTKYKEHIVIDFFIALAPRRLVRAMEIVCTVIIMGVLAVLFWEGILLVERTQEVTTIALGIPTMYMYAAVPVSAFLMLIQNLRLLWGAVRTR